MQIPISHSFNLEHGARFANFNGWQMPTFYTGIIEEHKATRTHIGLFDVSHMGRWWIIGKEASRFLDYITTNSVARLQSGRGLYTLMLNESGGIIDDLIVYKIDDAKFLLVNNAGNHQVDSDWLHAQAKGFAVELVDITKSWGQIAIQGPSAKAAVEKLLGLDKSLKYFDFVELGELVIAATGYTGEDGYELYAPSVILMRIWNDLIDDYQAVPCGLGSRDLLRLEAGYPLHGNDIDQETTPYEAGLDWVVKMDKDFIGKDHCMRNDKKIIGLSFTEGDKILPRHGTILLDNLGDTVGVISSGNFSPILNRAIAIGYLNSEATEVYVNMRGQKFKADIASTRFYSAIKKAIIK